jgi:hypothetical protein
MGMWKHAAVLGRYGDAAAYYSSLGGVWDLFWLIVTLVFAHKALSRSYFRTVVVPADPKVWGWIHRKLGSSEPAMLLVYRGFLFYGIGRMISWFLYARLEAKAPLGLYWGGPSFVAGDDLSSAGPLEVAIRTAIGGVLFAAFLFGCWRLFGRRLWTPKVMTRGGGRRRSASGPTPAALPPDV